MEVEDHHAVATTESQHFVAIVFAQRDRGKFEQLVLFHAMNHIAVEAIQPTVFQRIVIRQIPLATSILVRPTVSFSRKVYPLRMAEFVAHEVEIATGTERQGN